MFNLINKKNNWKNRILMMLLLWGIVFMSSQTASAWIYYEQFPKYWLKATTNNLANMLSSRTKAIKSYESSRYDPKANLFSTDLFWDNASKYRVKSQGKSYYGFESVKWVIKNKYSNCNLTDKEILWILFYTSGTGVYLKEEIIRTVPSWQWPTLNDKEKWCLKLSTCMNGTTEKYNNTACDEKVREAYFDWVNIKTRNYDIEESNLWSEKYYNWTLNDSKYDIYYDMGQLAKILYQDVTSVTETSVVFYKMPQFSNGWWWNWGGWNGWWWNGWDWNWGGWNWWWWSGWWWDWGDWNWWWWNGWWWNWGGWNGWWWDWNPPITEDDEINDFINDDTVDQETRTSNWNVAYTNKCVVSWSPKVDEAYLAAEEEEEWWDGISPMDIDEEFIKELIDDIIDNSEKLKITDESPLTWDNKKESDDVPWALWASTDPAVIEDLRNQLESCASKCDTLRFDERLICRAKCLCSEYSSKALKEDAKVKFLQEGALRIRICSIPSKPIIVSTTTKNVTSLEEIWMEIHDIVKALFESWELTPKMKKQEMLDTSMNNIKLSDVVSFNIWVQFKKPTKKRPVDKQSLEEVQKLLKDAIVGVTEDSFNVTPKDNIGTTSLSKTTEPPKQEQTSEDTKSLIKENKAAGINATIVDLLETHRLFLVELTNVINEMKKTTDAALAKIWK